MGGVIESHMHSDSQGCIEYRHRHGFVSVTVVVQLKIEVVVQTSDSFT